MGKATSNPRPEAEAKSKSSVTVVKDVCAEPVSMLIGFLQRMGINSDSVPDICKTKDFYSHLIHHIIKPDQVLRGRITCLLTVNPALSVTNSSHFFLFFFFFLLLLLPIHFCFLVAQKIYLFRKKFQNLGLINVLASGSYKVQKLYACFTVWCWRNCGGRRKMNYNFLYENLS